MKHNTFDIKKKNNVKVKEFKQAPGQKHFHPKPAKKISNQSFVAGLLKGSHKSKRIPAKKVVARRLTKPAKKAGNIRR